MTVTIDSPFRSSPRISEDKFVQVLQSVGSFNADPLWEPTPADRRPEAARDIYRVIVAEGHDPAVWLAILGKESTFGTNQNSVLWRSQTRSWTNARTARHPEVTQRAHAIFDPVRKSNYIRYQSVYDSVIDGLYRVDEPGYAYRKANAQSIVEHIRIWAPGSDDNKPGGYAETMAEWINQWMAADSGEKPEEPVSDIPGVPFVAADSRHYTRGRTVDWPDLLIQHHTDGWDSLAWLTTAAASNVSATYLLHHDGRIRAQLVRHADTPHTTGKMNPRSISIEWERKWPEQRSISDRQYQNIGAAWAEIVKAERKRGNPHFKGTPKREQLQPHNAYYQTTCPGNLDMDRVYAEMVKALKDEPGDRDPEALYIPGNPFGDVPIVLGFRQLFLDAGKAKFPDDPIAGGLSLFGYPKGPERATDFGSEQEFERTVLRYHRNTDRPFDLVQALREVS